MSIVKVFVADWQQAYFAPDICQLIEQAAKVRKTGIAKRDPSHIAERIQSGHSIIALCGNQLAGFCYIAAWENESFVSHSSLIVHPDFRGQGIANNLKKLAMALSKERYPHARIFGITTSSAVMKINHALGYKPVAFNELTKDEAFWKGCQGCPNYDILTRNDGKMCLCTALLTDSPEPLAFDLTHSILKPSAHEK